MFTALSVHYITNLRLVQICSSKHIKLLLLACFKRKSHSALRCASIFYPSKIAAQYKMQRQMSLRGCGGHLALRFSNFVPKNSNFIVTTTFGAAIFSQSKMKYFWFRDSVDQKCFVVPFLDSSRHSASIETNIVEQFYWNHEIIVKNLVSQK